MMDDGVDKTEPAVEMDKGGWFTKSFMDDNRVTLTRKTEAELKRVGTWWGDDGR
jgi:hypothetical protein